MPNVTRIVIPKGIPKQVLKFLSKETLECIVRDMSVSMYELERKHKLLEEKADTDRIRINELSEENYYLRVIR